MSDTVVDDLTFNVACLLSAETHNHRLEQQEGRHRQQQQQQQRQQQGNGNSNSSSGQQGTSSELFDVEEGRITNEAFVNALRQMAMQLHCHESSLLERLALERVRDYMTPSVPSARHHIYLLMRRHSPHELNSLPERLSGMSPSQLLDVLVLLDEAFGGSVAATSAVGDGFREVLLRNAVLERENAELSMQLKALQSKPKAQQNEAAFLVADLQSKLYESLGTLSRVKADIASRRTVSRTVATVTDLDGLALQRQQAEFARVQQEAANAAAAATSSAASSTQQQRCSLGHEEQIKALERKLQESTKRELSSQQELLTRMAQVAEMVRPSKESTEPLVERRSGGTQTDNDQVLVRLMAERKMLIERLAAATETLRKAK